MDDAMIYLFKVDNENTRTIYETCSKLNHSGVFIVNFEEISHITHHIVLVFPFLTLNMWFLIKTL